MMGETCYRIAIKKITFFAWRKVHAVILQLYCIIVIVERRKPGLFSIISFTNEHELRNEEETLGYWIKVSTN